MATFDEMRARVDDLRRWAAEERLRAATCAAVAARYEGGATQPPFSFAPERLKRAAIHRRAEECHRGAARLHDGHATRLQAELDKAEGTVIPGFAAAAAAALGMSSTAMVLLGSDRVTAVLAASDVTAKVAHDLEAVMGEGPLHALSGNGDAIRATGPALRDRWPRYGPALHGLGVQALLAVPLPLTGSPGMLCAYGQQPAITDNAAAAAVRIAAAAARGLLQVAPSLRDRADDAGLRRLGLADEQAVIHQAAGMVSVQSRCSISDALALLRARAFASGQSAEQIAAAVVHYGLRLD